MSQPFKCLKTEPNTVFEFAKLYRYTGLGESISAVLTLSITFPANNGYMTLVN